jgi:hypothetical protein
VKYGFLSALSFSFFFPDVFVIAGRVKKIKAGRQYNVKVRR